MAEILCKFAIKILQRYKRSVVLNYLVRGDIRPIYDNPILDYHHMKGKSYRDSRSVELLKDIE